MLCTRWTCGDCKALFDSAAYPKLMSYGIMKIYAYLREPGGVAEKAFLQSLVAEILDKLPPKGVEPWTDFGLHWVSLF